MDYVIFDLEWNQCPYGKGKENPKLPFEIIEIGAVKMDGERNVVGTFHRIVKPVVYQHLHHRTREVVGLTEEDLQNGIPFAQAVQEFFAFSGGACMPSPSSAITPTLCPAVRLAAQCFPPHPYRRLWT